MQNYKYFKKRKEKEKNNENLLLCYKIYYHIKYDFSILNLIIKCQI